MTPVETSAVETEKNRCQECGARVSPHWRRVFGNNEDEVYGCPQCTNSVERRCGHTRAAKDSETDLGALI